MPPDISAIDKGTSHSSQNKPRHGNNYPKGNFPLGGDKYEVAGGKYTTVTSMDEKFSLDKLSPF